MRNAKETSTIDAFNQNPKPLEKLASFSLCETRPVQLNLYPLHSYPAPLLISYFIRSFKGVPPPSPGIKENRSRHRDNPCTTVAASDSSRSFPTPTRRGQNHRSRKLCPAALLDTRGERLSHLARDIRHARTRAKASDYQAEGPHPTSLDLSSTP